MHVRKIIIPRGKSAYTDAQIKTLVKAMIASREDVKSKIKNKSLNRHLLGKKAMSTIRIIGLGE